MISGIIYTFDDPYAVEGATAVPTLKAARKGARAAVELEAGESEVRRLFVRGTTRLLLSSIFNREGFVERSEVVGRWKRVRRLNPQTELWETVGFVWEEGE